MDLNGQFNHFPDLIKELDQAAFQLLLSGHLNRNDLGFFLTDSIMKYIDKWSVISLETTAGYEYGKTVINELDFGVGNSRLLLKGILTNFQSGTQIIYLILC